MKGEVRYLKETYN